MADVAAVYNPMTTILLSGSLAKKFGRVHRRQVDSKRVWEALKALKVTLEGFEDEIRRLDRLGMRFAIFRNRKNEAVEGFDLGGTREVRIVPVVSGSKRAGLMQTVLGIVLIAVGFFAYGSTTAQGAALIAGGIASTAGGVIQMLSPQAKGLSQSASPENSPSYAFGSAKNTTASGNPVPICIGERRWGGMIISASILAEDKA
ncbi:MULTISPECIES: tail assembly protein [unclassified Pseudomonas]|uniref:tail assembly protein n=1 Tax=unclassified Pseudomonas TaxID=196821 RepID=UPI001B31F8ED|nr:MULTISPECIES: tail assembly protein [unclassified Pseudomonas]MBP5948267.1 tail assembly protein [Pseudomonas sp. P9(2020)]MBZ9560650.1 tail assembly protein [Pseudomonas sp. P116]